MTKKPFLIGVCGGSASGKTTLVKKLAKLFDKNELLMMGQDSYYHHCANLDQANFDEPKAVDFNLLINNIIDLMNWKIVQAPIYDFKTHSRKGYFERNPKSIIILDGILIFSNDELYNLIQYKIFVDTTEKTRFERRLARDMKERGRTKESVNKQFYDQVIPMHNLYVEPYKNKSDFVLDGDYFYEQQLKEIEKKLFNLI